ncbi:MAG TPA: hypothetical protein VFM14_01605 [Gemmatimonadales bacterium]|nr:hypothetical protein [Gemmatimonadales bacterium]
MSLCERLSDRMPAVAGGEAWTADEQAHLDACADCAAEWALVRSAKALGAGVAADLNAHHVTERVLGRLRADRSSERTRRWGYAFAGLAAAAAIVLAVSGAPTGRASSTGVDVAANLILPELDSLRTPELEALLRTMDRQADENGIDLAPPLPSDLEGEDLDGVLEALEG